MQVFSILRNHNSATSVNRKLVRAARARLAAVCGNAGVGCHLLCDNAHFDSRDTDIPIVAYKVNAERRGSAPNH